MNSPPIILSLASLGFGGNLSQLFFANISSISLRPDKHSLHHIETRQIQHLFNILFNFQIFPTMFCHSNLIILPHKFFHLYFSLKFYCSNFTAQILPLKFCNVVICQLVWYLNCEYYYMCLLVYKVF